MKHHKLLVVGLFATGTFFGGVDQLSNRVNHLYKPQNNLEERIEGVTWASDASEYNRRGIQYFVAKDYQKAEIEFRKGIEQYPQYADNYSMLGSCYLEQKKSHQAIEIIKKGITLSKHEGSTSLMHKTLARAYRDLKDRDNARREILQYKQIQENLGSLTEKKKRYIDEFLSSL